MEKKVVPKLSKKEQKKKELEELESLLGPISTGAPKTEEQPK